MSNLLIISKVFPQIKKALQTNEAFKILDSEDSLTGSDWTMGGCWFLANALKKLFPEAQLVQIYNPSSKKIEHVGIFISNFIWDANGRFTFENWIKHFIDEGVILNKNKAYEIKAFYGKNQTEIFPGSDAGIIKLAEFLKSKINL